VTAWRGRPRRSARQLARAVGNGRSVGDALRHLDVHGSEPDAPILADALAHFLVDRCESHHAGWRAVRRVVADSSSDPPWEKCARRAVPHVAGDLLSLSGEGGRTPLARAQHIAAQRCAEQVASHLDGPALLVELGLDARAAMSSERWADALSSAVSARSRDQVARAVDHALRD
jgi:hypothetical protein